MSTSESRIALMSSRTASHIQHLFVVAPEQSVQEAHEILSLIESKGGDCTNWVVVSDLIEKQLGNRLEWRRASDKLAAAKDREDTVASYTAYLNLGKRTTW